MSEPLTEEPYHPGDAPTVPWTHARQALEEAEAYALATVRRDGRPHLVPVLGVWTDGALHVAAGPTTRKARNLAHAPQAVVSARAGGLDLVVEGDVERVDDEPRLHEVAAAYADKYGWQVEVRDGAFHAEGAPSAGPPPYHVHRLAPTAAFAFPVDAPTGPTRWRFR